MGGHVPNHQPQFLLFCIRVIPRSPMCECGGTWVRWFTIPQSPLDLLHLDDRISREQFIGFTVHLRHLLRRSQICGRIQRNSPRGESHVVEGEEAWRPQDGEWLQRDGPLYGDWRQRHCSHRCCRRSTSHPCPKAESERHEKAGRKESECSLRNRLEMLLCDRPAVRRWGDVTSTVYRKSQANIREVLSRLRIKMLRENQLAHNEHL